MAEGPAPAPAAPPAAPEPAVTPEPQGQTYDPGTHVLVPKEQLGYCEGRYGTAIRESHEYRTAKESGVLDDGVSDFVELARRNNMTAAQLMEHITSEDPVPPQTPPAQPGYGAPPAPAPPVPTDPNEQPLTVAKFNAIRQSDRAEAATAATQQQTEQLLGQEYDAVATTLRDFKFSISDDGHPEGSVAEIAQGVMNKLITEVMRDEIPDNLTGDERQTMLKSLGGTPSTPAQREKAKALFQARWADLQNDAVSRFATNQEIVPGGSLEAGAGGPVQKRSDQMTYEEKVDQLAGAMTQQGHPIG